MVDHGPYCVTMSSADSSQVASMLAVGMSQGMHEVINAPGGYRRLSGLAVSDCPLFVPEPLPSSGTSLVAELVQLGLILTSHKSFFLSSHKSAFDQPLDSAAKQRHSQLRRLRCRLLAAASIPTHPHRGNHPHRSSRLLVFIHGIAKCLLVI